MTIQVLKQVVGDLLAELRQRGEINADTEMHWFNPMNVQQLGLVTYHENYPQINNVCILKHLEDWRSPNDSLRGAPMIPQKPTQIAHLYVHEVENESTLHLQVNDDETIFYYVGEDPTWLSLIQSILTIKSQLKFALNRLKSAN